MVKPIISNLGDFYSMVYFDFYVFYTPVLSIERLRWSFFAFHNGGVNFNYVMFFQGTHILN